MAASSVSPNRSNNATLNAWFDMLRLSPLAGSRNLFALFLPGAFLAGH